MNTENGYNNYAPLPTNNNYQQYSTIPDLEKPTYCARDNVFALLSIIVGFLFVRTLPVVQNTLGGILFMLLLFTFSAIYLVRSKIRPKKQSIIFGAVLCIFSLGLIFGANAILQRLLYLFLILGFLYWVYTMCSLNGESLFCDNIIYHGMHALFVIPLTSANHFFKALAVRKSKLFSKKFFSTFGWILLGLIIAVIPTAIIALMLSYDEQFTSIMNKIFDIPFEDVWEYIRDIFLGFVVAIFLFGVLFATKWQNHLNNGAEKSFKKMNIHVFPQALLCAAITPILVIYLIFFISQWNYYISAFTHTLPENLTYATYAREGFFQLCWISAINAVMLLLFNVLIAAKPNGKNLVKKAYSFVISLFTLILIATALSKMVLYIESFGLTRKRVYASWLMLLLALIFILVIMKQFTRNFRLIPAIVLSCIIAFGIIAIPDVDGMIASYNVNAYLEENLEDVDVVSISEYGVSAVPSLVKLQDELNSRETLTENECKMQENVNYALENISRGLSNEPKGIFNVNIPEIRARKLLKIE